MQHVVVLGGSVAGLTAARVLRQSRVRVTIVEPDDPLDVRRSGVPQHDQLHALLDMGRTQMDRWFPGLSQDLVDDGAVLGAGSQVQAFMAGVRKVSVPGNELIGVTRGLLESHVRRRVLGDDGVTLVRGKACGLAFTSTRVSAVRYRAMGSARVHELRADAVVDAMGRSSRLSAWLKEHGWPAPPVERMHIDLGYATALFRRAGELPEVRVAHVVPGPARTTAEQRDTGALAAVEGDRWMVLIAAFGDSKPSRDPQEFRKRMQDMQAPPFGEIARQCEMLSEVHTYRMAHSQRRTFTAVKRLPGGLFAVGDSVASFNPV
ncbi:FAD-dependent oxidoreductase [Streptomyces sp. NPDC059003]|uniref:FAD-dependent oxidoreductase n=1 Tax=Streptomyces sp. NPDC059003 TaxID=3346691 RepID=UPI0036875C70